MFALFVFLFQLSSWCFGKEMYHISETNKTFILNKLYYEIYDKYEQNETYIEASTAEPETYAWLLEDAVHIFVKLFHDREKFRPLNSTLAAIPWGDVRSSSPLPTDDAFRTHCYPHVCQEDSGGGDHWATGDRCVIDVDALANSSSKDGSSPAPCIFVRASLLPLFVQRELPRINTTVVIVTDRYNDQSVPDSQTTPSLRLAKWSFLADLTRYHEAGKVKALHGVNTWWVEYTKPRPTFVHCLPIGLESRGGSHGGQVDMYLDFMVRARRLNLNSSISPGHYRPLLLVPLDGYVTPNKPDRAKAQAALNRNGFPTSHRMNHHDFLLEIPRYKFVAVPHGHGLDTHRMTEVLLMGGVPVVRLSTISSCYDDTDNAIGGATRGSLPIVIVNEWSEVTKERLEKEWARISSVPPHRWDWRRIFADHWIERVDLSR